MDVDAAILKARELIQESGLALVCSVSSVDIVNKTGSEKELRFTFD
jgi:hypothetical protein